MKNLKYIITLILCLGFILSGCKEKVEISEEELPIINVTWTNQKQLNNIEIPYSPIKFEANVLPYEIEADLSNIENKELFPEFSEDQIRELVENGFFIVPNDISEASEVTDAPDIDINIPRFITSDLVLHNYHELYNEYLSYIEEKYLYENLKSLTNGMLENSIKVSKIIQDPSLIDLAHENIAYFLVGKMLINGNSYVDLDIDDSIIDLAKKEYALINEGEGNYYSPLFDKQLDYSQFAVKGHYRKNEAYERFYKTRVWYGFAPMQLMVNQGKGLNVENVQKSLLMTYITFVNGENEDKSSIGLWNSIYTPRNLFSPSSENINVLEIKDIIIKVFGENLDINEIGNKSHFAALFEEIRKLPNLNDTEKQFGFMDTFDNVNEEVLEELKSNLIYNKSDNNPNMPFYMKNEYWVNKAINTIQGSYAEFINEKAINQDEITEETPTLYVEPNIELYSKLLWIMRNSTANLEKRGLISEELLNKSKEFISLLEFTIDCSMKELNDEDLLEEEKEKLNKVLLIEPEIPNNVYVIIPFEGKLYLTRGVIYSSILDNIKEDDKIDEN